MILNENTSFYKVCFDSMHVGIIVFDSDKNIVLANNPSAQLFGYSQQQILNHKINPLFKDHSIFDLFINNPNAKVFQSPIELKGITQNGSTIFTELSLGEMEYENKHYYKILISDISLRKEKEKEINHLNVRLAGELKIKNNELKKTIQQLKISLNKEIELNSLKTKFMGLASHEFKTPLSAILSSTELMDKYADLQNIEKRKEHLGKIKTMISRLNNMLDGFLTLENIEKGVIKENHALFEIGDLATFLVQNFSLLLKRDQKLRFNINENERVYHDKNILTIILSNLILNAIKYSNENDKIEVTISTNNLNIYINVKDSGIGIPENEQNLIFQRFFRAKNALFFPGTGIGLNIVKGYVQNLNGSISFESVENKGTVFKVQLPKITSYEKKGIIN